MNEQLETPKLETRNSALAIVGIGCLFPGAAGPGWYWANVKNGVDGIAAVPPTHWDPADYFDPDPKRPDMTYARRGGFLEPVPFDPMAFGISPRDLEATDTSQLLGLVAAKQALDDAGLDLANRDRVSVILGVTGTLELVIPLGARLGHPKWKRAMAAAGVPADVAEDAADRIAAEYVPWQENSFPGLLGNVVAGRIANKLDLGGTNCVVDAACASSLSAVHLAAMELQTGRADVVVTGGVDTFNDIFMYMCFSKTPALSPTGDAKPFDAAGDGTILGEGLGVVVLKRLADAEAAGDTVYAVIKGMGSSSDGKGNAVYAPSAAGQEKCLRRAYANAGVTPDTVELVEAHGTGTRVGDAVEITALTNVYASGGGLKIDDLRSKIEDNTGPAANLQSTIFNLKSRPWCAVGSVKSQIGHTKAAAGSASLIKAALALYNKVLPPTLKVTEPVGPLRAADSPFYVNTRMRPWLPRADHPRRAALSAFGFGGSNFHAVLEEHRPEKAAPDWDGTVEVVALSADTAGELAAELGKLVAVLTPPPNPLPDAGRGNRSDSPPGVGEGAGSVSPSPLRGGGRGEGSHPSWPAFARAAEASRASFRADARHRLCFAAHRTATDLPKLLAGAAAKLRSESDASWHTPDGVHYGVGPAAGGLAVLFPGQGSQQVGMLRELACLFPELLDALAAADAAVAAQSPADTDARRLSDRVYPPPSFDPAREKADDADLRDTRHAQPALGAVGYGAWRVLSDRFGVTADAFAGHSYGELVALAAAGRLAPADLFALSRLRGDLMAAGRAGDPGAMLAVIAPLAEVERLLADHRLNLVVANYNAPRQAVLSGPTADVEGAERAFAAAGVKSVRLPVAAAFHSPLVADAAGPLRAALDGVELAAGTAPVYANTTAAVYPADGAAAKDVLANQLANPVRFADQVRGLAAAGVRAFVEVGPGAVLTRLVEATLADAGIDAEAFALDSSAGKRPGVLDLGNLLARLAAGGHPVRLTAWEEGSRCRPAAEAPAGGRLTVAISGANHVTPREKRPPAAPRDSTSPLAGEVAGRSPAGGGSGRGQEPPHPQASGLLPSPARGEGMSRPAPVAPLAPLPTGPVKVHPMPDADPSALAQALQATQQSLAAVQRMHDQAAQLHRQFLDGQEAAHRTLQALVEQQQALLFSGLGAGVPLPALPPAPAHPGTAGILPATVPVPAASAPPPVYVPPPPVVHAPPPVAPVPAPVAATPAPPASGGRQLVEAALIDVVAEKTGYPAGSLSLGLSLDADLGVDSIKRVEILSALQERLPAAPPVKPEHLGRLHTLQDVADFLGGSAAATVVVPRPADRATPPPAGVPAGEVADALLEVVAEKTGYPPGSLSLALSLDSDLGVDSIKRVEILSALQEKLPAAPQVKPEHLGRLHTLQDVADFLSGRGGSPRADGPATARIPVAPVVTPKTPPPKPVEANGSRAHLPAAEAVERSTVQAVDLDPNAPRPRVRLAAGAEVWVVGEPGGLTEQVADQLRRRGLTPKACGWSPVSAPGARPAGLVLLAPAAPPADGSLSRAGFEWLKLAAGGLRAAGKAGGGLFVTVARLDGAFGFGELRPTADPAAGGLAGLAKTARHEWPEVACKALDLDPAFADPAAAAAAVVDEAFAVGPAEVGVAAGHRCTLELARTARRPAPQPVELGPKDVVLITGGGRGVTADSAVAFAGPHGPALALTGRTPAPGPEPDWLAGQATEAEVKKAIADRLGPAAGPRQIGDEYARVAAERDIRRTLERITLAGGRAAYFPADAADPAAVAALLRQVRDRLGPVTALVHGAGVLADKRIEDLSAADFDRVYRTKVDGLRHLLDGLAGAELKVLALFSSTTARLGRVGQAAYACANEVLNKTAQAEARRRPNARVVAVNWGPWDGGMVTPGLRKQFEAEGVGLIPPADGAAFLRRELAAAGRAVEVVALGRPAPAAPTTVGSGTAPALPVSPSPDLALVFERTLDLDTHPVLRSHVIDGRAVLPMSLHLEFLAHAALHGNPGMLFLGANDLRITKGVTLAPGESATLRAFAGKPTRGDGGQLLVPVELRSKRRNGQEAVRSRAEVVLGSALPPAPPADPPPELPAYPYSVEVAYADYLFHGPDLHGLTRIDGMDETGMTAAAAPAPPPAGWFAAPPRSAWVADPLALDSSFQMMCLWCRHRHGSTSLPNFAGRYRQYRRGFPADGVGVAVRITRDNGTFVRVDMDYLDADGRLVARLQDYECMIDPALNGAFRRNQLAPVG